MSRAQLSSLVVMMDCCHAGFFVEQESREERPNFLQSTEETLKKRENSCFIGACRDFERARADKEHGIFTAQLLKGLAVDNAKEGAVTSNDLISFVSRQLENSGQEVIQATSSFESDQSCTTGLQDFRALC